MNTQFYANTVNYKELVSSCCLALNTPLETLKALFKEKEVTVVEFSSEKKKEIMIEVRFDGATANCLFDKNQICDGVCVFLDDSSELENYIQVCSLLYPYDSTLKSWVNIDSIIQSGDEKEEYDLIFLSLRRIIENPAYKTKFSK